MIEGIFVTHEAKETQEIGKKFAEKLRGGDIVALYGELGSGKTTFVQGLAKGLGVRRRIISPTFIIVRQYKAELPSSSSEVPPSGTESRSNSRQARTVHFYHVDLYRIEREEDTQGLGLEEILKDQDSIVAIEWAEKMGDLLPKRRWNVRFEHISEEERRLAVDKFT